MSKILKVIGGLCKDCQHYEYIDSKSRMDCSWWHWGYCHKIIHRDDTDKESICDLSDYFQVTEDEYCSDFKERIPDE